MTPLSYSIDVVVVLICGGVLLYCQMLSRRLRAMHNLKSGVGEAIVNLSAAIKQSTDANQQIAADARDALVSIDDAIGRIQKERQVAEDLLETLDGQIHRARRTLNGPIEVAEKLAERMDVVNDRARIEMEALTKAVAITNKVSMLVSSRRRKIAEEKSEESSENVHTLGDGAKGRNPENPFKQQIAEKKTEVRS